MVSKPLGPRRPLDPVDEIVELGHGGEDGKDLRLLAQRYQDGWIYEYRIPHGSIYDQAGGAWSYQNDGLFNGAVLLGASQGTEEYSTVGMWYTEEAHERLLQRPEFQGLRKKLRLN
ncbi:hypothetical protein [Spirillospora sp. NPDC047279]|uniref:hypothetical protein n=1 Tax=Spirillospora sp. NPDC047279 TaxID=3155478 RepID=UPI0033CDFBE7